MNKAELVEKVRSAGQLSKSQAEAAVDEVLQSVIGAVKSGERVSIFGFGTFNPTSRAARTGRNPQTGEPVKIAASKSVRFAPASAFKSALNTKRAGKKAAPAKAAGRPSKVAGKATGKAPGKATGKKAPAATKAAKSIKKR